jgi:hypothetical protein
MVSHAGLFFVSTLDGVVYVNSTEGEGVVSLAVDHANAAVWAGTQHKLWRFDGSERWAFFWCSIPFLTCSRHAKRTHTLGLMTLRVPAVVDAVPVSLTLDDAGRLWVPNDESITVIAPDLTATRVRGDNGLPVVNLTASAFASSRSGSSSGGAVWFGSKMGLLRHRPEAAADDQDPAWRYFFGARWLPGKGFDQGQSVVSLAVSHGGADVDETAVAVTDGGLSIVRQESGWTLKRKAEHYQAMVKPRHDRLGYVCSCNLGAFGDLSSWQPQADENSGLWTSMYLASQVFRYAVTKARTHAHTHTRTRTHARTHTHTHTHTYTHSSPLMTTLDPQDPEVKREAWRHFEAMGT